jgi:class 3 adenylate cyclase
MSHRKVDVGYLDAKIREHSLRKSELEDLGQEIAASARPTVVTFIDLAGSTEIKEGTTPEEWLGFIYEFIRRCSQLIQESKGTVIKRIGDEVMATFRGADDAESFLIAIRADKTLRKYDYKVALDFGDAYHFQFIDGGEEDPYGTVVDRCARIAKLAKAGSILCSGEYKAQLRDDGSYQSVGEVPLKGIGIPCHIYFRSLVAIDSEAYLRPLITSINSTAPFMDGFRTVGQRLAAAEMQSIPDGTVRPFLVQELLNFPKSKYSFRAFSAMYSKTSDKDEKEAFAQSYVGYLFDWEGTFDEIAHNDRSELWISVTQGESRIRLILRLPRFYLEMARAFKKNQKMSGRGIYEKFSGPLGILNYVEVDGGE